MTSAAPKHKRRWWSSPSCYRYINELIEGAPAADLQRWFSPQDCQNGGKPTAEACGVGRCGDAEKKMKLLSADIVEFLDLYEITLRRIYALAFNDIPANFTEVEDLPLLQAGLLSDCALIERDYTYYAVTITRIEGTTVGRLHVPREIV